MSKHTKFGTVRGVAVVSVSDVIERILVGNPIDAQIKRDLRLALASIQSAAGIALREVTPGDYRRYGKIH